MLNKIKMKEKKSKNLHLHNNLKYLGEWSFGVYDTKAEWFIFNNFSKQRINFY